LRYFQLVLCLFELSQPLDPVGFILIIFDLLFLLFVFIELIFFLPIVVPNGVIFLQLRQFLSEGFYLRILIVSVDFILTVFILLFFTHSGFSFQSLFFKVVQTLFLCFGVLLSLNPELLLLRLKESEEPQSLSLIISNIELPLSGSFLGLPLEPFLLLKPKLILLILKVLVLFYN